MSLVSVDRNPADLSLTMVAEFDAPIDQVWQLWADPRKLERWWGPPGWPATVLEHDLSVGGVTTYVMDGPGGAQSRGWWRVTAIDSPHAIDFVDGWTNSDGTPNEEAPSTHVQVRLSQDPSTTRMQLRFVFGSREHWERIEKLGAFEVFPQCVAQMDAVL